MSQESTVTRDTDAARPSGSEELLKETLKRCSRETLDAALEYRKTGDVDRVPAIVLGIIERFLDPDVADKLRSGDKDVRFMEDLGLDSLTMIEAIMMVEESLGVSIKNEELISLRTVGDLEGFIREKITGLSSETTSKQFSFEEVAAVMPQQDPFLFLQEAALDVRSGKGSYKISGQEAFLEGHFKGNPVFPASIMLEALGQLAVFLLLKNPPVELNGGNLDSGNVYFTGADGVRCFKVCKPGDKLEMEVKLKRAHEPLAVFSGTITVNGEKAVAADEITLAYANEKKNGTNGTHINGVNGH